MTVPIRRPLLLLVIAAAALGGPAARVGLGLRHEPGVETRLQLSALAAFEPLPSLRLQGGLAANVARPGWPDRFALEAGWSFGPRAGVAAGAVWRRWPAWRAGENLVFAAARAEPVGRLALEAGLARRVPLLDSAGWDSPFGWTSPVAEWNVVYGIGWRLVDRPGLRLAVSTGNREPLALRTPGLVGIRFDGEKRLGAGWAGTAGLAFELKGLSSALLEPGAVELELGVRRGAGR